MQHAHLRPLSTSSLYSFMCFLCARPPLIDDASEDARCSCLPGPAARISTVLTHLGDVACALVHPPCLLSRWPLSSCLHALQAEVWIAACWYDCVWLMLVCAVVVPVCCRSKVRKCMNQLHQGPLCVACTRGPALRTLNATFIIYFCSCLPRQRGDSDG